jgi:hypothetical protein
MNDLKHVKEKHASVLSPEFPGIDVAQFKACVTCTATLDRYQVPIVHSRRRDSVNKASPASPQLTARSGQSAQFSVLTAFGRTLTCIQTLDTPATVHTSRDFILRAKEISRAFVYDDSLLSANGL